MHSAASDERVYVLQGTSLGAVDGAVAPTTGSGRHQVDGYDWQIDVGAPWPVQAATEEIVVIMHRGCGLHGGSEDDYRRALAADGILPTWRLGAFDDLEDTLKQSLARLRSARELPHRDHIRGFVFDPEDGSLREIGSQA